MCNLLNVVLYTVYSGMCNLLNVVLYTAPVLSSGSNSAVMIIHACLCTVM